MAQNVLPLIEIDYYNCIWNKRILTPQSDIQTSTGTSSVPVAVVPGGTGVDANNVYPLGNVYAAPFTGVTSAGYPGSAVLNVSWNNQLVPQPRIQVSGSLVKENMYIEESRIRGGFGNVQMDLGVRAYLDEEDPIQQHRFNTLIYSGIYNSRTGINRTNEFPIGTNISRSANPQYNAIQKIYAEENNLVVLQEDKCSRCLIDKNAIYNAEGGGNVTTSNQVLGEIVPYTGEYGISKNPESFAIYANRKYFVDRHRNAVLRLSNNGVTEISEYGMRDYFRDRLAPLNDNYTNEFTKQIPTIDTVSAINDPVALLPASGSVLFLPLGSVGTKSQYNIGAKVFWSQDSGSSYIDTGATVSSIGLDVTGTYDVIFLSSNIGSGFSNVTALDARIRLVSKYRSLIPSGWDSYNKQYVISIQPNNSTLDDTSGVVKRDSTYFTLGFDEAINGWPSFYTYRPGFLGSLKSSFFTINNWVWNGSSYIVNGLYQHYNTTSARGNFYGINNPSTIKFVANSQPSTQKVFLSIGYEGASGWKITSADSDQTGSSLKYDNSGNLTGQWYNFFDSSSLIYSYEEGAYVDLPTSQVLRAGFDRKENNYVANFVNNSPVNPGEIVFGNQVSGLKGYYLDITMSTDGVTDPGAMKELYAVNLNYNVSNF
tara:strand:- start:49 stop:2007 length:1959 start_codon:yes stop_codon:yes gene_type:complete